MKLPKSIEELRKTLGFSKKTLRNIEKNTPFYVPYDAIHLLLELGQDQNGQTQINEYMIFLDLNFTSYSTQKGEDYYLVKLYKNNDDSYSILEELKEPLGFNLDKSDEYKKENKISINQLNIFLEKVKKENKIILPPEDPYKSFSDELSKRDNILREYLSNKYIKIAGRKFEDNEQDLYDANLNITVSFKKPKNVSKTKVLSHISGDLIEPELREQIREAVAIDEILDGIPHYDEKLHIGKFGAVLYGPAGTGKTSIMRAYKAAFRELGAYVDEVDLSKIDDGYKGGPARRLSKIFVDALKAAKKNSIPSLICVDEGDMLVEKKDKTFDDNYYSGLIRTGKQYIGNKGGLIVIISTNLTKKSFDDALTRGGRLKKVYVPRPKREKLKEAWKKFIEVDFKLKFSEKLNDDFYLILSNLVYENEKTYGEMKAFCLDYSKKNLTINPKEFIDHFQKMLSTVWASNEDDISDIEFEQGFQNIVSQGINIQTALPLEEFNKEINQWFISKKSDLKSNSSLSNNRILSIFEVVTQVIYYIKNEYNYVISNKIYLSKPIQSMDTLNFLEQVFNYLKDNDLEQEEIKSYSKEGFYILFKEEEKNSEKDITPNSSEKIINDRENSSNSDVSKSFLNDLDYIKNNLDKLEKINNGEIKGDNKNLIITQFIRRINNISTNIKVYDQENKISRPILFNYEKEVYLKCQNIIQILNKLSLKPMLNSEDYLILIRLINQVIKQSQ